MGLLRRKKDKDDKQQPAAPAAVPAVDIESDKKDQQPAGNLFTRFKNYLIDSYNGLYKIFLSGYVPQTKTFQLLFVGMIIGFFWSYVINPTQFYNAAPHQMSAEARNQWIKMAAGSHYAGMYGDEGIRTLLSQVEDPAGNVAQLAASAQPNTIERQALQNIQGLSAGLTGRSSPQPASIVSSVIQMIVPFVIVAVLMIVLNLAWKVVVYQYVWFPIEDFFRVRMDKQYAEEKKKRQATLAEARERRKKQEEMAAAADDVALGDPLTKKLSIYTRGRAFDDSFEIEGKPAVAGTPGDFLGECGASIASKNDAGDPNAIEVWLFEMANPADTLTKIFVTPAAASDPAIRANLETRVNNPATDIIVASPNAKLAIDGQGLKLQATISSAAFSADNTIYENLEMQIFVWEVGGQSVSAPPIPQPSPMGAGLPQTPPMQPQQPLQSPPLQPQQPLQPLQPPPLQPQQPLQPLQPPPLQPQQPLQSPPLKPRQNDDDPFGGTGDFTPLGG